MPRFHKVASNPWFRFALIAAAVGIGLSVFIELTEKFYEGKLQAFDRGILLWVAENMRTPRLTGVAVDLTALGSSTLGALATLFACFAFVAARDRRGALQVGLVSLGAAALTLIFKDFVRRARPDMVPHLVEVFGYSYPSGHALSAAAIYLTIALVAGRHAASTGLQILFLALGTLMAGVIGLSRIYLGVHYPSDVLSGFFLGAAWAFLVHASFFLQQQLGQSPGRRKTSRSNAR